MFLSECNYRWGRFWNTSRSLAVDMNAALRNTATCDIQYCLHPLYRSMSGRERGYDSEDGFYTIQLHTARPETPRSAKRNRLPHDNDQIMILPRLPFPLNRNIIS